MVKAFLKIKHWQLFVSGYFIPMVFQVILFGVIFGKMFISIKDAQEPDLSIYFSSFSYYFIVTLISFFVLFNWYYALAIGLRDKLPKDIVLSPGIFKATFILILAFNLMTLLFVATMFNSIGNAFSEVGAANNGDFSPQFIASNNNFMLFPVFMIIGFLSMVGTIYMYYFIAKTLKTIELQREVKFSEFIAEFFMIWFPFVGFWMIQPKVNKWSKEL